MISTVASLVSSACAVSVCTLMLHSGQLSVTLHVLNDVFWLHYVLRFSQLLHACVRLINCMHARRRETYCKYPVQLTSLNQRGEARTLFSSRVNNSGIPFDKILLAQFIRSVETCIVLSSPPKGSGARIQPCYSRCLWAGSRTWVLAISEGAGFSNSLSKQKTSFFSRKKRGARIQW